MYTTQILQQNHDDRIDKLHKKYVSKLEQLLVTFIGDDSSIYEKIATILTEYHTEILEEVLKLEKEIKNG